MASIMSRRLCGARPLTRYCQPRVFQRYLSQSAAGDGNIQIDALRAKIEASRAALQSMVEDIQKSSLDEEAKRSALKTVLGKIGDVQSKESLSGVSVEQLKKELSGEEFDSLSDLDPNMNGGYKNPPAVKRSLRDPYGDWWDKQDRRNYGEPVHEDNDILGVFSLEEYRHFKPGRAGVLVGTFVACFLGFTGVVYMFYPDRPSVPRTFPDGLDIELGGKGALPALADDN